MPEKSEDHPGDPGWRLRRHRYQEGPGVLFLAALRSNIVPVREAQA
jgi:hypothetical protein